jgi:inosose dehydratase
VRARVAGAPVSFGVFELTPEGAETVTPDAMLETLQESGYAGVDLGPLGYLGRGEELGRRLTRFDLALAGGWVQLPFSDDEAFEAAIPALRDALRVFAAGAESSPSHLPLPTLADDGSARRRGAPGRGAEVDELDRAAWDRLVANAGRAAALVRAAGFEPTFHHHAGTFVESPAEIDRFLGEVDIGLTLDTGHLVIAGGDPVEALTRWSGRINHLHLKDVDLDVLRAVIGDGGGMREVWSSGAFVAFGRGDIDLDAVMTAVDALDFDGWLVVEQDVLNGPDVSIEAFEAERARDQKLNRDALRQWL